ncbi:DUF2304 domain-containing protein [Peribacillus loiseleuriae]|uniref:DUF2304 domain-containing protein n=1 Tax=Peribacillus loiseleuriae TaxID=1679170 RepID=UPI003CFE5C5B
MISYVSFGIVCVLFIVLIASLRKGIIETKYSILWFIVCVIMAILSLSKELLEFLANILGVDYAPSILFLFGILFMIILIFDLTRRVSDLNKKLSALIQDYAILKSEMKDK